MMRMTDDFPAITHSVIFKCIGVFKDHRYQETLSLVAKKLREGGEVPVRLQKEPKNPVDSCAIAFQCQVHENWERIGYVVRKALDSVHAAMDSGDILKICFDWVKYIVQFKDRGFYAGILITRRGEWPRSVMQCRAKSFVWCTFFQTVFLGHHKRYIHACTCYFQAWVIIV